MNARTLTLAAALTALGHAALAQDIRLGPFLQDAEPTSIWVCWETTSGLQSLVEFGTSAGALTSNANGLAIASQNGAQIHQTQLTGLAPDTAYFYRVRTGAASSPVFRFRTPPLASAEKPFRFVAYSDTQGGPIPSKHTEIINEGVIAFIRDNFGQLIEDELAFAIEPGDLVDAGSVYDQWKTQFFDEEQNLLQHVPLYPAIGNHEQDSHWYFDYFRLPENGTPGFLEHWYYKDYGNVRIIACDSNDAYRLPQQLTWVDAVLADAAADDDIDFVFAQMHHPHLSEPWTPGNTPYVGEIVARLEAFSTATGKPSIHFFGHTHAYSRGQSMDHDHLWVNVAAGEGSIDYWGLYPRQDYPEYQKSFVDWGFVLMEVEGGDDPKFRLRRISRGNEIQLRDNEVMDDITIRVNNQQPAAPAPVTPPGGASDVPARGAILTATPFSDLDGDIHLESHFQLTTTAGDYSSPIDQWIRFENWFAPPDATSRETGYYSVNTVTDPDITRTTLGDLQEFTTYHWRVRYRDGSLGWSEWSDELSFTTGALPKGPCCLPDGGCDELTEEACLAARGTFLGVGADCDCPPAILLFAEDFDGVDLGPSVDEPAAQDVWSATGPVGWSVDRSAMPTGGVTEWRGWAFADPAWWSQVAGDQGRSGFTKAAGATAIADPDEWDDKAHASGTFNSTLSSPAIDVSGAAAGSVRLWIDSSWVPFENQRAQVRVRFDGGDPVIVADWPSSGAGAKAAAPNETIALDIPNPEGASLMVLEFLLLDAGNDWWWAIDNLQVVAAPRTGRRTLLDQRFDSIPLGPFVSPSESGGDGTDWTATLPAGWSRDNTTTPIGGPVEFYGFTVLDKTSWIATSGNQARDTFSRASGSVLVADPDEYDDIGNIDPDLFNVELRTSAIPLAGIAAHSVEVGFDSSFRPYDAETGALDVSFDSGASFSNLLTLTTANSGGASSLSRANEAILLPLANPAGGTMILRFSMLDAGNDWWWAIDNLLVTGACIADLAAPFGSLDTNDFFAFLSFFQAGDPRADATGDGSLNTNDFFAFLAAYQAGC